MPTMKVLAVKQIASGESDKGAWTRQKVRLEDRGGERGFIDGQLFCHQYVPVPNEGDELDVKEIKQPENPAWLPEIVLVKKGGGGGYSGPRLDDPKTRNSIAMQSSLKLAWEVVRVSLEAGLIKPPEERRHEWLMGLVMDDGTTIYKLVQGAQDG